MYDAYIPLIERAGGIPRIVKLSPPHWTFGEDDLAAVFSDRTRAVMITTPNNPTTHCLGREELALLETYCERFDAVVISDEVWEQVVFDQPHLGVLHLPGLARRAVKIGSAGKVFALTGWKVGFVCAAPGLIDQIARAHQFITFATPPALQHAVAHGLGLPDARFAAALAELRGQRDYLGAAVTNAGFTVLPAEGTYFINIDLKAAGIAGSGLHFAQALIRDHGLATIPLQASVRRAAICRCCACVSPSRWPRSTRA